MQRLECGNDGSQNMFPIFADLRQYRGKCCDYGKQQYKDKTYTRLPTTNWIYRNIRSISLVEFIAINRKKQENGKKLKLLSILIHLVMLVPLRLALKGTMRYWRFFISVLVIFLLLRYNIANLFWSDPYGEKHHQLGRHR